MAELLLIVLLLLSSSPLHAEWVFITTSEADGGFSIYVDNESVHRKGEMVQYWTLYDYKTVQTGKGGVYPHLSRMDQREIDCAGNRFRNLSLTLYSGNMKHGEIILSSSGEGEWKSALPGTIAHTMRDFICSVSNDPTNLSHFNMQAIQPLIQAPAPRSQ